MSDLRQKHITTNVGKTVTGVRILLVLLAAVTGPAVGIYADDVPEWLDTIAPHCTVEPQKRWHRKIINVTLSADEPARLWIAREDPKKMKRYRKPLTITREGIYHFYFYAEDDFGNKSALDSCTYVIDSRPPELSFSPQPGTYRKNTPITLTATEPVRFFTASEPVPEAGRKKLDGATLLLTDDYEGYFGAVDSAGNVTFSGKVKYVIDTSRLIISVSPEGGIFNHPQKVTFTHKKDITVFYTFDPLAPAEWFTRYEKPVSLPHGLTLLRYYGRTPSGEMSEIIKEPFVLDTVAPRLYTSVRKGEAADTLYFNCKETAEIRYTNDGTIPVTTSTKYTGPLLIPHEGISRVTAKAWDKAGNISEVLIWEHKYDFVPPNVTAQPAGGKYREALNVLLIANEPAKILYTLNGDSVGENALIYSGDGIPLTRQGSTIIRFRAIDRAFNSSEEQHVEYMIDSRPPKLHAHILGDIAKNRFEVHLGSREKVTIHYSVNSADPTSVSPVYTGPIFLKSGDVLRYFGVDTMGNATRVYMMDDLEKPMVEAQPPGGLYNRRIKITFEQTVAGKIWWRLLPDTLFRTVLDTIVLDKEGSHSFEYFIQTPDGVQGFVRRNEYFLDWTAPQVAIRVQKGAADSAVIFFDADENASIYYTIDGTNPLFSGTTKTSGNKFQRSRDRIALMRDPEMKLAYYAEDAAGNQSALTILDVFKPRVIPNIPAGADRIHNRILSVQLQAQDGSVVHYRRHGKEPTLKSPVYQDPIILTESDTINAFVVDISGYRGEPEEFIYMIDLPPSPQFLIAPDTVFPGKEITLDASGTFDGESPKERLIYRWDFDDNGVFDTDSGYYPVISHTFRNSGMKNVVLEVTDENGNAAVFNREIPVYKTCPEDMVASFDTGGGAFCIDRHEWPNQKGEIPLVNVSWVEAKMFCIDAGKRLCRSAEWISICRNKTKTMYPYGDRYDENRCYTEQDGVGKAGEKNGCSAGGATDMVGNAWEWVEEKNGDYVRAFGGSFRYGKDAHCTLEFEGTVATRSNETGFRCCK